MQNPMVFAWHLFAAILFLFCHLSIRDCAFVLACIRALWKQTLRSIGHDGANTDCSPDSVKSDIRSVIGVLQLVPHCVVYSTCPKCNACYSPSEGVPERCSHIGANGKACNRTLRKPGSKHAKPVRPYVYHSFKLWWARMLSRPGLEEMMDRAAEPMPTNSVNDILGGKGLRDFLGPDGKPFLRKVGSEGRYLFEIFMDGFNPFQSKEAGKKVSCGAIYMVCLNLPPDMRFKVENMFLVGIIPGPREASLAEINGFLAPLVNDLLDFWDPGVYYTRTAAYKEGRRCRCAIVPLVSDLPAARQMMGRASFSSNNFCTYCSLQLQDIDNIDQSTWPRGYTFKEHRRHAEAWRNAKTSNEREDLYRRFGVRWSELLRLPYWDPTRYTLIDSMHALLLGLLRRHCFIVWHMNDKYVDSLGLPVFDDVDIGPSEEAIEAGLRAMGSGSENLLWKLKRPVLAEMCRMHEIPLRRNRKKEMVKALIVYVRALQLSPYRIDGYFSATIMALFLKTTW